MALYPLTPKPSSVSAPAWIDPALSFVSDSGYESRRVLHSRPRRRFVLEYLGATTQQRREIRDFLLWHRFGNGEVISFAHPTAFDTVPSTATVPVTLNYAHELVTGQSVGISFPAGPLQGTWRITRLGTTDIALDGSTTGGGVNVVVYNYLPNVVARFSEDTMEAPGTIIGPDQIGTAGGRVGYWNFQVTLEEVF